MALRQESHVLVVGGSDSSGGAGIARDIETLSSMGVRSCLAVTAVTVQTHDSVTDILHLHPVWWPIRCVQRSRGRRGVVSAGAAVMIGAGGRGKERLSFENSRLRVPTMHNGRVFQRGAFLLRSASEGQALGSPRAPA